MSTTPTDPFAPRPDAGLSGFVCPDGEMIPFADCLAKCRMASRCAPRPILHAIGAKWVRKSSEPSTTELAGPTRIAWLRRMYPYYESAASRKWALLGTAAAAVLEGSEGPQELSEETLRDAINRGTFDHYDAETQTLLDWKLIGAYKIMKLVVVEREVPGEVFRSGPRKGMPRQEKVEDVAGAGARLWTEAPDWAWQLCDYANKLEAIGFPVKRAVDFIISRDSDGYARQLGLTQPWYEIEVPRKSREEVEAFFRERRAALEKHLVSGECPPICTPTERWDGKRCESYCPVRAWCDRHDGEALRKSST